MSDFTLHPVTLQTVSGVFSWFGFREPFEPSQSRSRHAAGIGGGSGRGDCSRDYEVMKLRRSTSEPKVEKDRRNNEERVMDQKIIRNPLHF